MSEISRREVLRFLLGAPLAAQACQRSASKPPPGRIVGATESVGHRLRRSNPGIHSDAGSVVRVGTVIVGAGPSGLCAAWRLERLGQRDFVVLELEPRAGGTSAFGTDGVVPYPWGAHYVPVPHPENRALTVLLQELGALEGPAGLRAAETVRIRAPEERLFLDGAWHEGLFPHHGASAEDRRELDRFTKEMHAWASRRDSSGRRAFVVPLEKSSDDATFTELDRESAASFLDRRRYRSKRLRWYVEYACRDDYGLSLENTSAWAMVFYFAARFRNGKAAPFVTWPEGNGRIVRHLTGVAGDRVRLGHLVTDIEPSRDGVDIGAIDVKSQTAVRYRAKHVIAAVPKFVLPRIVTRWRQRPPRYVSDFSYGTWLVANLHLRSRPRSNGLPFAWDNVLYDSPSLGYIVATHQALSDYGPTIWTYYRPFTGDDPRAERRVLLSLTHAEMAEGILADLERAHDGLREAVERIDICRWGHAMVRPTPGFIWGTSRREASTPLDRLHFAHSDLSGLALFEEAQFHGIAAAEAVVRAGGREISSLI